MYGTVLYCTGIILYNFRSTTSKCYLFSRNRQIAFRRMKFSNLNIDDTIGISIIGFHFRISHPIFKKSIDHLVIHDSDNIQRSTQKKNLRRTNFILMLKMNKDPLRMRKSRMQRQNMNIREFEIDSTFVCNEVSPTCTRAQRPYLNQLSHGLRFIGTVGNDTSAASSQLLDTVAYVVFPF